MVEDPSIHGTETAMLRVPLGSAGGAQVEMSRYRVPISRV